jgi:hypothetical protein
MPAFIFAPDPHPDDQEYNQKNGENWWPDNHALRHRTKSLLSGTLHEFLHKVEKGEKPV